MPAGETARFTYEISNRGVRGIFHIVAACGSFTTNVEANDITLRSGETAKLRVSVTVPKGTPAFTGSDLTWIGSYSDSNEWRRFGISNGTSRHLLVSPEGR